MRLVSYGLVLRRNWLIMGLIIVLGTAATAGLVLVQPAKYVSSTRVFFSIDSATTTSDLNLGASFSQQVASNFADVANSTAIVGPVVQRLGLSESASTVSRQVTATVDPNSVVLTITAETASPDRSARIANAIVTQLRSELGRLTPAARSQVAAVNMTQIQPAEPSERPSSPNVPIWFAGGVLGSLAIALLVAVAREWLLRDPSDLFGTRQTNEDA